MPALPSPSQKWGLHPGANSACMCPPSSPHRALNLPRCRPTASSPWDSALPFLKDRRKEPSLLERQPCPSTGPGEPPKDSPKGQSRPGRWLCPERRDGPKPAPASSLVPRSPGPSLQVQASCLDTQEIRALPISQPSLSSRGCSDPHSCQPQSHCFCCFLCPPPRPAQTLCHPAPQLVSIPAQMSLLPPHLSEQPGPRCNRDHTVVNELGPSLWAWLLKVPRQAGTLPGPR